MRKNPKMCPPALKSLIKKSSLQLMCGRVVVMRKKKNAGLIELPGSLIVRDVIRVNKRMNQNDPARSEALININTF